MAGLFGKNLRSALRRALAPTVHRLGLSGPYRGNVDGLRGGSVMGWAVRSKSGEGKVPVGLFTSDGMIASMTADLARPDVAEAGIGDGCSGFEFPLTETLRQQAAMTGGHLTVRVLDKNRPTIGQVAIETELSVTMEVGKHRLAECRSTLHGDLQKLLALLDEVGEVTGPLEPVRQPPFERHKIMFSTENLLPDLPPSGQPAYLDFARYRLRVDKNFDVGPGLDAADHFLNWYLTAFRVKDRLRVPISNELIGYLNAPVAMGGQHYNLSRIMWWRLLGNPGMLAQLNLNDRDAYIALFSGG
jgi:hypothetical protein